MGILFPKESGPTARTMPPAMTRAVDGAFQKTFLWVNCDHFVGIYEAWCFSLSFLISNRTKYMNKIFLRPFAAKVIYYKKTTSFHSSRLLFQTLSWFNYYPHSMLLSYISYINLAQNKNAFQTANSLFISSGGVKNWPFILTFVRLKTTLKKKRDQWIIWINKSIRDDRIISLSKKESIGLKTN